jgi:hypothetical protein
VENITCDNVGPALREQVSATEDHQSHDAEPIGKSPSEPAASIDHPQSAIENPRRRPYVKTPARLAAARANLERARAAPKEKVYRRTEKRLAASRANLAKARGARHKELRKSILAGGLMAVLGNSRLVRRAEQLNRRVVKLLEAFVEKRYERANVVVSTETLFKRAMAPVAGLPPLPQRGRRPRPQSTPALPNPQRQPAEAAQQGQGPDLSGDGEEFVRLVRRAFCASHPEPEDEAIRDLIDDLGACLWDRLRMFDDEVKCETARLIQELDRMADTPPDEGRNHVQRRCWSIEAQLKLTVRSAGNVIKMGDEVLPERLGALMMRRYGPDPEIERFYSASCQLRAGNRES